MSHKILKYKGKKPGLARLKARSHVDPKIGSTVPEKIAKAINKAKPDPVEFCFEAAVEKVIVDIDATAKVTSADVTIGVSDDRDLKQTIGALRRTVAKQEKKIKSLGKLLKQAYDNVIYHLPTGGLRVDDNIGFDLISGLQFRRKQAAQRGIEVGHGTHVAGIIGCQKLGSGNIGYGFVSLRSEHREHVDSVLMDRNQTIVERVRPPALGRYLPPPVRLRLALAAPVVVLEDSPASRARRLLAGLSADAQARRPLAEKGQALAALAATSAEAQEQLWESLLTSRPEVRWLVMEILADLDFPRLAPELVRVVEAAHDVDEREFLLGALVTIRKGRIADDLRPHLLKALRARLGSSLPAARSGAQPLQTEVLGETIGTFRSFADARDLPMLRPFWQMDCTYRIQLRALQALQFVAGRYPAEKETEAFFAQESPVLIQQFGDLARVRLVAVENGALLWTLAEALAARLGPESLLLAEAAVEHAPLHEKLRRIFQDAMERLRRLKQERWLEHGAASLSGLEKILAKTCAGATVAT